MNLLVCLHLLTCILCMCEHDVLGIIGGNEVLELCIIFRERLQLG